jgi:TMEM151 family
LCSPSSRALRSVVSQDELDEYVNDLRRTRPVVKASIQNYHYESRQVQETYTDKDGKSHTRWRTKTYRVNTHYAAERWAYDSVRDVSGPPVYQPEITALRIHFRAVQDFSSAESRAAFERWREKFYYEHTCDSHQDRRFDFHVPGLQSYVMLRKERGGWLQWHVQALAVLFLCGGLYQGTVLETVPHVKYKIVKQLHSRG